MFDSTAARQIRRSVLAATSTLALVMGASVAFAQQPAAPAKPAPARPAAPKAAPKQAPTAQAPAAQQPAQNEQQQQQQQVQLVFSPWTKFCNKAPDPNAKQVCFTARDARTEAGIPAVAAALIEPEGEPKKILRVTLPSPVMLQYGSRIVIDQNPPLASAFFTCFANGCMADYEGTPDLIQKLKTGQGMQVMAVNINGQQFGFTVPLADFKKANEGPPTDPKVFEEQQKKLQEDLQKKADELRKKLESQGQAQQAPGTPPR